MNNKGTHSVEAVLNDIRFRGEDGFIIGIFSCDGEQFGGLGNILNPETGLTYHLFGEWIQHHQYGKQIKFQRYNIVKPKDTRSIYKYLVKTARFVGPKIGNVLIDKYGDQTLEILKKNPKKVANEIKGLSEDRAFEIQKELCDQEEIESVLIDLEKLLVIPGLRRSLPFDLVNKYGSDAAVRLKENPYILTDFNGIGFTMADRIALSINFDPDSSFRKQAGLIHVLKENEHDGHVWMDKKNLVTTAIGFLNVKQISGEIDILLESGKIMELDGWLSLIRSHTNESYISQKICQLLL